jgi:Holliday junction resolvasome RuvABC endonuclease subunit
MIVAGIDYSLSCPALCVHDSSKGKLNYQNSKFYFRSNLVRFELFKEGNIHGENHKPYKCDMDRYDDISDWALSILDEAGVKKVFLEGYSYGSTGRVFHIAENTGVLKYNLWDAKIPVEIIPPTTIKKFATGKGNANKQKMYESFVEENPSIDLRSSLTPRSSNVISPVSDIVDAYFITKYGLSMH